MTRSDFMLLLLIIIVVLLVLIMFGVGVTTAGTTW